MRINIVSKDERYFHVNELLLQKGCDSFICTPSNLDKCDVLILSVRDEYTPKELESIFNELDSKTLVFCGNKDKISQYFRGRVVDYGHNESFLLANARLTAEATVTFLHNLTKDTIRGKSVFVAGYGRIGTELSRLLSIFGADVSVYARRKSVRTEIEARGYKAAELDDCVNSQIIINTVPNRIFRAEIIEKIPPFAHIVELASEPYGFDSMERVSLASALPGKILQRGAAYAVFDTIYSTLSLMGKDNI